MRAIARVVIAVIIVAAVATAFHSYGWPWEWPILLNGGEYSGSRAPAQGVRTRSLPSYVARVADKPWFVRYFTRMAFADPTGPPKYSGVLTKWDKSSIRIHVLDDGGQGMRAYVDHLAHRLNRIQKSFDISVVDGSAEITIEYMSHRDFERQVDDSAFVGFCRTSYGGTGELSSAAIIVDAGRLRSTSARKATVIHELTHALGFNGHFRGKNDRQRSVLCYASTITMWSQSDAAAIRVLYSQAVEGGMGVNQVRLALRHSHLTH